jgi:hypothetical protein
LEDYEEFLMQGIRYTLFPYAEKVIAGDSGATIEPPAIERRRQESIR